MILQDLIAEVKKEKSTSLTDGELVGKLNEIESIVQDFLKTPSTERVSYSWEKDKAKTLVVGEPYSVMYGSYLKAQIDYVNEELQSYANNQAQFSADYDEWAAFAVRTGLYPKRENTSITGWW